MEQDAQQMKGKLQMYSELMNRMNFAFKMGMSYEGERDLYKSLGYKSTLNFPDYYGQYLRQDIARAIIERPVKTTWRGPVEVLESDDADVTPFEKAWKELENDLGLKSKFARVDRLTGLGRYGILLLGLNDARTRDDLLQPVKGQVLKLNYVKPLGEESAKIDSYERRTNSERYGMPVYYEITLNEPGNSSSNTLKVHHSRVIHIVEDPLESEIYGTPRLQAVFNRLKDLEKLVGGSAEMFWRGARPGYSAQVDPEFTMTGPQEDELQKQINEYEHNLRRILVNEGVTLKELGSQVSDPANHVDIQIQMISAVTGIPKRILTGSERGELASTEDKEQWLSFIQARREEFAETQIILPFIERCQQYGVLPETDEFTIKWQDLFAPSEKDQAEVGRIRATALKEYASQPATESMVPLQAFFEFFLGLNTEQIELITKMQQELPDEDDITDEEREIMERENEEE